MGKVLNCKTPKILMDMRRGDEKRREGRKGQEREEDRRGEDRREKRRGQEREEDRREEELSLSYMCS